MNFKEYYLKESTSQFVIPSKIQIHYQMVGDLSNIKNWKAKIILGNSLSRDQKKGNFENVGYVGISLSSNVIIPIARSDEHQAGYEFINYLANKKLIPNEEYFTVYNGSNYIYSEDDYKDAKIAYKKWLLYGGNDNSVDGNNDNNFRVYMSDVVNSNSLKELNDNTNNITGKLNPVGKKIISDLEQLAKLSVIVNAKPTKINIEQYNNKASNFLYNNMWTLIDCDVDLSKEKMDSISIKNDYKNTDEILFTMNGVKNQIHQALRNTTPKDNYKYNKLVKIFGDVNLAKKEFDRLGNI